MKYLKASFGILLMSFLLLGFIKINKEEPQENKEYELVVPD